MARLTYAEMAAQVMDHFIDHAAHGYSQTNRDGDGTTETIKLSDGTEVSFSGGDRDCSRLIQTCYVVVGVLPRGQWMWTGNEREMLAANGFVEVPVSSAQRGDVLWRSGHTEMHLGNNTQGGARIDEVGGITGPSKGDQTGQEIARSTFNPGSWASCWRCTKERPSERVPAVQRPGDAKNNLGIRYSAHVQNDGWLPEVHDGQAAGTTWQGIRMEAIMLTLPEGLELDAIAHVQNLGSLLYEDVGASGKQMQIGTTWRSLRLEAVTFHIKKNTTGKTLYYQGHVQNKGWMDVCKAGERCGTRWQGLRLEAIRIWME